MKMTTHFSLSAEHHTMKTWGSGCVTPRILILVLDGGEWSASHPQPLYPREKRPW